MYDERQLILVRLGILDPKRRTGTPKTEATNYKCSFQAIFSSLTGANRSSSEVELGLLSAAAPEPDRASVRGTV
jgi:hypothetical protein